MSFIAAVTARRSIHDRAEGAHGREPGSPSAAMTRSRSGSVRLRRGHPAASTALTAEWTFARAVVEHDHEGEVTG